MDAKTASASLLLAGLGFACQPAGLESEYSLFAENPCAYAGLDFGELVCQNAQLYKCSADEQGNPIVAVDLTDELPRECAGLCNAEGTYYPNAYDLPRSESDSVAAMPATADQPNGLLEERFLVGAKLQNDHVLSDSEASSLDVDWRVWRNGPQPVSMRKVHFDKGRRVQELGIREVPGDSASFGIVRNFGPNLAGRQMELSYRFEGAPNMSLWVFASGSDMTVDEADNGALREVGNNLCAESGELPCTVAVDFKPDDQALTLREILPAGAEKLWIKIEGNGGKLSLSSLRFLQPEWGVGVFSWDLWSNTPFNPDPVATAAARDLMCLGAETRGERPTIHLSQLDSWVRYHDGDQSQFTGPKISMSQGIDGIELSAIGSAGLLFVPESNMSSLYDEPMASHAQLSNRILTLDYDLQGSPRDGWFQVIAMNRVIADEIPTCAPSGEGCGDLATSDGHGHTSVLSELPTGGAVPLCSESQQIWSGEENGACVLEQTMPAAAGEIRYMLPMGTAALAIKVGSVRSGSKLILRDIRID